MKPIKLEKKLVLNVEKISVLDEDALSTIRGGVGAGATAASCSRSNGCVSCVTVPPEVTSQPV